MPSFRRLCIIIHNVCLHLKPRLLVHCLRSCCIRSRRQIRQFEEDEDLPEEGEEGHARKELDCARQLGVRFEQLARYFVSFAMQYGGRGLSLRATAMVTSMTWAKMSSEQIVTDRRVERSAKKVSSRPNMADGFV